jgi:hypothetical protein
MFNRLAIRFKVIVVSWRGSAAGLYFQHLAFATLPEIRASVPLTIDTISLR